MANDDRITQAYWLPIPALRRRVHYLLYRYLTVTRPSIMSRRPAHVFNHPFLFVSARAHDGGHVGDPYTVRAFRHAWDAAIKRLSRRMGDAEIRPLKSLGTTPHGSRHFAGHFLKLLRVPTEIITRVMNHRDPTSQEAYGRLSAFEVNELLQGMAAGLTRSDFTIILCRKLQLFQPNSRKMGVCTMNPIINFKTVDGGTVSFNPSADHRNAGGDARIEMKVEMHYCP